ncbi:uncharacterized protein METZ01_LOCUS339208 [marine metagenome]|uniref:Uncharacterized protein n=1 Tax=marine metagenome TaxID=408172 RepID=A0A382QLJ6_9ZZZZ
MAAMAGLEANIHPRYTVTVGSPPRISEISKNAALSGVSSGGFFSHIRAMILRVPN